MTLLRTLPVFEGLDTEQLSAVAGALVPRRVGPGVDIFTEGERSTSLFIMTAGAVGTSKRMGLAAQDAGTGARQKVLVHLRAPQFFGEMGLLTDLERSATITTDTECELLELSRSEFDRLVMADARLGYRLVRNIAVVLADRLRRSDLDVLKLTTALSLALGNR
ncbi:MAG TPA: cyclic nucleotide-binding domain-containing protein [Candidatus Limnocylindria bacterium]